MYVLSFFSPMHAIVFFYFATYRAFFRVYFAKQKTFFSFSIPFQSPECTRKDKNTIQQLFVGKQRNSGKHDERWNGNFWVVVLENWKDPHSLSKNHISYMQRVCYPKKMHSISTIYSACQFERSSKITKEKFSKLEQWKCIHSLLACVQVLCLKNL